MFQQIVPSCLQILHSQFVLSKINANFFVAKNFWYGYNVTLRRVCPSIKPFVLVMHSDTRKPRVLEFRVLENYTLFFFIFCRFLKIFHSGTGQRKYQVPSPTLKFITNGKKWWKTFLIRFSVQWKFPKLPFFWIWLDFVGIRMQASLSLLWRWHCMNGWTWQFWCGQIFLHDLNCFCKSHEFSLQE